MNIISSFLLLPLILVAGLLPGAQERAATAASMGGDNDGLLFYHSGENPEWADFAVGKRRASILNGVRTVEDGALGRGLSCEHKTQIFGFAAPGNIYAQRGTLSFFWRARDPIGRTPFPIFQVFYSDHSSIDMAWLRIDFNGKGFDAFVTDANLARWRVSHQPEKLPEPSQWVHFGLAWDENSGLRFSVNGRPAGSHSGRAVLDAGLDQIAGHGDVVGPQHFYTGEIYLRGGDLDEIRVYDQMLSDGQMASLARGEAPAVPALRRSLADPLYRQEWWLRHGWNRPAQAPPYLKDASTQVRKVEIHEVYDLKQWNWKGTDGIRETTWPGVYNRSSLPGRTDYFVRPDWNCYSISGRAVDFHLPAEAWNHLEISGAAAGDFSLHPRRHEKSPGEEPLFRRPDGQERTFHRLPAPVTGGVVHFDNAVPEVPIGELGAYFVAPGPAPGGLVTLNYRLTSRVEPINSSLQELKGYIEGRFPADERALMVAQPPGAPAPPRAGSPASGRLPQVHILVPFEFRGDWEDPRAQIAQSPGTTSLSEYSYTWENIQAGLDGIALDLPPLQVAATHGEFHPLRLQIKDPLWPDRNLLDFSFSVKPGEARSLWLDTRDRLLPSGRSLYLILAGAGADFGPEVLENASLRLIFKEREKALPEHEADRFTQVKDNVGNFMEWHPNNKKLRLYDRFSRDITSLFEADPNHLKGRYYWSYLNPEQGWPAFQHSRVPEGIPAWAHRQVELVGLLRHFINWWIDNRQIENGEFGGGLSDDGDLTNLWPGAALMGIDPEKVRHSLRIQTDAFYEQGLFTDGLATMFTDDLHAYEEGIQAVSQSMLLEHGDPQVLERAMETARALERVTGFDSLGHRHMRSSLYSGTEVSEDPLWAVSRSNYGYLILHPALLLVDYNRNPAARRLLLELAEGLLAHRKKGPDGHYHLPEEVQMPSGEDRGRGLGSALHLLWAAWNWTRDPKYLQPVEDTLQAGNYAVLQRLNADVLSLLPWRQTWGRALLGLLSSGSGTRSDQRASWPIADSRSPFEKHVAWQMSSDFSYLTGYYEQQVQLASQTMAMYTEDHFWTDRVSFPMSELQRSRLGGVALMRNALYPGHAVSWDFPAPGRAESVALAVPEAGGRRIRILAFNLEQVPVDALLTAWSLEAGRWEMRAGRDEDGDQKADEGAERRLIDLERGQSLELTFPPRAAWVVELELQTPAPPVWERPDLGIGAEDVGRDGDRLRVTVHSLGSAPSPATRVALLDGRGTVLASTELEGMEAPLDLRPRTRTLSLAIPAGSSLRGTRVVLNPDRSFAEITRLNNQAAVPIE